MNIRRVVVFGMALLALIALSAAPAVAQTQVSLGGYVKYEALYDSIINKAGINKALPGVNSIPFTKGPGRDIIASRNDEFIQEIRETRFNVTLTDSVGAVKLKAFAESDFFGGSATGAEFGNNNVSNSALLRLRHAFGQGEMPVGPGTFTLLAGQFWSAFGYLGESFGKPATIDFTGNPGLFRRTPQLRLQYGIPFGKSTLNLRGAVQVHGPSFTTTGKSVTRATLDENRQEGQTTPEFVAKVQWLSPLFSAEVAGLFAQNRAIDATRGNREHSDAVGVQGTLFIPIGPLGIHLHGDYLEGANGEATGAFPDAVFLGPGKDVGNVNTTGAFGGLSYKLLPTTTLNAVYDIRSADSSAFTGFGTGTNAFTDNVRLQTAHFNILHRFWKRFQAGVEYEYQKREAFRQNEGRHNIYHFALYYFF